MSDQIDISREACEQSSRALHRLAEPFGKPCTEGLMITALRAALDAAEAEKRNIVSHATMGETTGEGMSLNDICVAITAGRNKLYTAGKAAVDAERARAVEAERERCAQVADAAAKGRQAQMDSPDRRGDRMQQKRWRVGKQQAEILAAAIRTGANPSTCYCGRAVCNYDADTGCGIT